MIRPGPCVAAWHTARLLRFSAASFLQPTVARSDAAGRQAGALVQPSDGAEIVALAWSPDSHFRAARVWVDGQMSPVILLGSQILPISGCRRVWIEPVSDVRRCGATTTGPWSLGVAGAAQPICQQVGELVAFTRMPCAEGRMILPPTVSGRGPLLYAAGPLTETPIAHFVWEGVERAWFGVSNNNNLLPGPVGGGVSRAVSAVARTDAPLSTLTPNAWGTALGFTLAAAADNGDWQVEVIDTTPTDEMRVYTSVSVPPGDYWLRYAWQQRYPLSMC